MRQSAPLLKIPAFGLLIALVLPLAILLGTFSVQAAEIQNPIKAKEFKDVITRITDFAVDVIGPLSALMVFIAGAMYMTAGGNTDRLKRANKTLLWAVIGIAIVLLAKSVEFLIRDILKIS